MVCIQNDVVCPNYFLSLLLRWIISLFFSWWFEVVKVVQLLLNKILQIKKKKITCVRNSGMSLESPEKVSLLSIGMSHHPPILSLIPGVTASVTCTPWDPYHCCCFLRVQRSCCLLDELVLFFLCSKDKIQDASVIAPTRSEMLDTLTPSLLLCRKW